MGSSIKVIRVASMSVGLVEKRFTGDALLMPAYRNDTLLALFQMNSEHCTKLRCL